MKTNCTIVITTVIFTLLPLIYGQCPEICDGDKNTALGQSALVNNANGTNNTAVGFEALSSFTSGYGNTAVGFQALSHSTEIFNNTAIGWNALAANTTGSSEVAVGSEALAANIFGWNNTAVGHFALTLNTNGVGNTACGHFSLYSNTSAGDNTAIGDGSLFGNTTGRNNIAIGSSAGLYLDTGSNNIEIGNQGNSGEANTIRIGTEGTQTATYVAGIRGTGLVHGTALAVGITPDGQLGVRNSSARFKEAIKPMDKASEAILGLKPVTFRYKKDLDPKGAPQFGLVAEEVAKVNPDLVVADEQGKPFTVRYDEVNAMLLNEFLKEHKKVEELEKQLQQMSARLDAKGL